MKLILHKFDFYLQLSHSESLSTSIIEAQSKGLPVIVSNSDGMPEALINGKTGISLDPSDIESAADFMHNLWLNGNEYNSYSQEAVKFVNSKFTISIEVEKLKNLYLNLTKK